MPLHSAAAARALVALCSAIALCAPAAAQSVVKQHQLTSATSFCCSGGVGYYYSPWVGTDGRMYSDNGPWGSSWSWGDFQSTAEPGSFSGSIRLQAQTAYGVHVRALGGEIWNGSSDTLYASSTTLPVGTPVTLRFELRIDGDWGPQGRSLLNVAGMAQVESSAGYPGERVVTIDRSDLLTVGGSWGFDTQYRVWGDGLTGKVIDGAAWDSFVTGQASLTIEVLGSDAKLTSASLHNYAPVPEPATWALALAGLATVISRRRVLRLTH